MNKRKLFLLLLVLAASGGEVFSQRAAVKTNALHVAAAWTPNLAGEVRASDRLTIDFMAGYNPWGLKGTEESNKKAVHLYLSPELRYWTCEPFNGHFFGVHAVGAMMNISQYDVPLLGLEKEYRYEGNAFGGGLSYGYHLPLSAAWGLEFTVGAGVLFMNYGKYDCPRCGEKIDDYTKTYFGPTRAGVSLVYILK
jgi:hypothetical protein